MTTDQTKRVYSTLNGIRGLAACAVATLHGQGFFGEFVAWGGYLAVDLFFVLSGFVLAHAYEDRFARGMTVSGFFWIRTLRLYPLYLLGAVIGSVSAVLAWILGAGDLTSNQLALAIAFNAVMLPIPVFEPSMRLYPVNVPGWSLFFELAVNVVYVALYSKLTERILIAIVILSAIGLAILGLQAGHLDLGSIWGSFAGGTLRVLFSFFMGVLLYRRRGAIRYGAGVAWLSLALVLAVVAIPVATELRTGYDLICVLFVFPVLVALAAASQPDRISSEIFDKLGIMSFALYAVHVPVFEFVRRVVRMAGGDPALLSPWAGFGLLALLVPVAILLERFYDSPIRRFVNNRRQASAVSMMLREDRRTRRTR